MTLGRYEIFSDNSKLLDGMDYLFYADVDMRFVDYVGDEILGDLVATQHPGYFGREGTPERNPISLAYINPSEKNQYFAGGFNGGSKISYLNMAKKISENIKTDYCKNYIAIWHDESHLNKYLLDNPPEVILSPSYCYGEDMNLPFNKKLIALNKNHGQLRK